MTPARPAGTHRFLPHVSDGVEITAHDLDSAVTWAYFTEET